MGTRLGGRNLGLGPVLGIVLKSDSWVVARHFLKIPHPHQSHRSWKNHFFAPRRGVVQAAASLPSAPRPVATRCPALRSSPARLSARTQRHKYSKAVTPPPAIWRTRWHLKRISRRRLSRWRTSFGSNICGLSYRAVPSIRPLAVKPVTCQRCLPDGPRRVGRTHRTR